MSTPSFHSRYNGLAEHVRHDGRHVVQTETAEAYKAQLMSRGASEAVAQGLVDMYAAKDNGLDNHEAQTAGTTTATSFQWCEEVFKPASWVDSDGV